MDMEKVIKGVHDARRYLEDREWVDKSVGVHIDALNDSLAMLKEDCHNCKLECLLQKYDELKEKYDALLKEQEKKQITLHKKHVITWGRNDEFSMRKLYEAICETLLDEGELIIARTDDHEKVDFTFYVTK